MTNLEVAVETLSMTVGLTPGVKFYENEPPEQLSPEDFPAVLVYCSRGNSRKFTHGGEDNHPTIIENHVITADVHFNRKQDGLGLSLTKAQKIISPMVISIFRRFLKDKFNNSVINLGDPESKEDPITYELMNLGWGSVDTIGYRIRIKIAVEEEIVI